MKSPPTLANGRYLLVKPLGEGGMATVYRAYDQRLQVWRAVKILSPEFAGKPKLRQRFEAEAQTMALLEHAHIVRVYDVGHEGDVAFIVMELVESGCLVDWLDTNGPMPPSMAVGVVAQICDALTAAHAKGVIHRDIKPHNVMITRDGVCRVTDFGIARVADTDLSQTKTGAVMGTWGFMAPEQKTDAKHVDVRADLYATGASLYSLLTNRLPGDLFFADRDDSMLEGVHPALIPVLLKATQYRRDDRYPNMAALKAALEEVLPTLPVDPPQTPPLARDPGDAPPAPDPMQFARRESARTEADFLDDGGRTLLPPVGSAGDTILPEQGGMRAAATQAPQMIAGAQLSAQPGGGWTPQTIPPQDPRGGAGLRWALAGGMGLLGLALMAVAGGLVWWKLQSPLVTVDAPPAEGPVDAPPVDAPPVDAPPVDAPPVERPPELPVAPPVEPQRAPRDPEPKRVVVPQPETHKAPLTVTVIPKPEEDAPPAVAQCLQGVSGPARLDLAAGARFTAKLCVEDGTPVELWFRPRGAGAWNSVRMPVALGTHRAKLDLDERFQAGLEYYITAGEARYGSAGAPLVVGP